MTSFRHACLKDIFGTCKTSFRHVVWVYCCIELYYNNSKEYN